MREIINVQKWERTIVVFFAALILLTWLGPFGTYQLFGFWERLAYWLSVMIGVGFFMQVIITVALHTRYLGRANQFVRILLGCILAALPGAVVVIFTDNVFRDAPIEPSELPEVWAQVTVIGLMISLVEFVDWGRKDTAEPSPIRTRFHARLNPDLGQVVSLSMQDHYVEVTCTNGTQMILMRLSDAMAELDGLQGCQTHRSHWVAQEAIESVDKAGQKMTVTLRDGRVLPVSTTFAENVLAAAQKT